MLKRAQRFGGLKTFAVNMCSVLFFYFVQCLRIYYNIRLALEVLYEEPCCFILHAVRRCEATSASDYVEFSNFMARDRKYSRHCGQLKDFDIESDRKFFRVTFWSNDRLDGTGFNASYQFIDDVDPANTVRPTHQAGRAPSLNVEGKCQGGHSMSCRIIF